MSVSLKGKVALVTGASSGIGLSTAIELARQGAKVSIVARRDDRLRALQEHLELEGHEVLAIVADVAREEDAGRIVLETKERFGRLDIVVNNAGVMLLGPVLHADTNDWRRMVETNLLGLMYVCHAALPVLKDQKSGILINVSSTAGRVATSPAAVYCATKFGVGAFSEALRKEVFAWGVKVCLIEPGVVETELRDHITHQATKDDIESWAQSLRQLQPADIAHAIVYAASQPDHVNVNEILVRPTDQER